EIAGGGGEPCQVRLSPLHDHVHVARRPAYTVGVGREPANQHVADLVAFERGQDPGGVEPHPVSRARPWSSATNDAAPRPRSSRSAMSIAAVLARCPRSSSSCPIRETPSSSRSPITPSRRSSDSTDGETSPRSTREI